MTNPALADYPCYGYTPPYCGGYFIGFGGGFERFHHHHDRDFGHHDFDRDHDRDHDRDRDFGFHHGSHSDHDSMAGRGGFGGVRESGGQGHVEMPGAHASHGGGAGGGGRGGGGGGGARR